MRRFQLSVLRWLTGRALRPAATAALAALLAFLPVGEANAQLPQTRLYSLFPPGGQAGTSVEVQVTSGDDLDELNALRFNHPGIKAVQKMQESGGKQTPVERTFVVTIEESVPPGLYAVRAGGLFGMSNPRAFAVGEREETRESEGNNEPGQADEIRLGQIVNGQASDRDIDYFKFQGKKGQRIIATAQAARIDSRMIATLELYDSAGRRLAFAKDNIREDPLLDVTLPADGEYFLKAYDFLYQGGPQHFYRLRVGTGPHIDFVMPPSGLPGTTETYTLFGRNLPGSQPAGVAIDGRPLEKLDVSISLPDDESVLQTVQNLTPVEAVVDAVSYVHRTPEGSSNPVPIYLATAPVVREQEPNDAPEHSQQIQVPAEYVGQFQAPGDQDLVTFEAKAGEVYYVEVFAQRCGTRADPYFVLEQVTKNDQGVESVKRIQASDDDNTNLAPNVFDTLTDDPVYRFQVPADGTYRLTVRDRYFEVHGNPRLVYRLSIRRQQPDFRLVAFPTIPAPGNNRIASTWSVGLRKGDSFLVDVLAFRRDGFDGTIEVTAEGLPKGVRCTGALIGPKQNSAALVLTADEDAEEWSGTIRVVGKTRLDDPQKEQAVESAQAAVKSASEELAKLQPNVAKAEEQLQKAKEALAEAEKAAKENPDDEGLKQKLEQAQKAAETAEAEAKKANEQKAAAEKKLADAQAALRKARQEHQNSIREVTRQARAGTIAWAGANNQPGIPRLAKGLGLSVLKEPAPLQVLAEVDRVEVNQGRQILVPVKLHKRMGFDNNVNLQFLGLPKNSNIQVQNTQIKKGQNEALLRIFANNNAVPGAYTLYLKTQAQVSYRRNPERAERAKAAQQKAAEQLNQATEAAKKAAQQRDAAVKKAEEDAKALKAAEEAKSAAEKKAAEAQAAAKKAEEERDKAKQAAEEAEKAAKDDPNKAEEAKKAAEALQAAEKALQEAQQAAKKAAEELAGAEKARAEAEQAAKASAEARTKAEEAAKQAEAQRKAAEEAKKAADKRAQDAENAAKPKNTNVAPPSTPILIEVKPAPVQLSASVPGGGNLKRGQNIEVKVTVKRVNGFEGPVTLSLPAVPGVEGISAEPVTVPAEKNEGVLTIQAAGDATEGGLANMVIRGTMEFNGKAAVDVPISLKVSK